MNRDEPEVTGLPEWFEYDHLGGVKKPWPLWTVPIFCLLLITPLTIAFLIEIL